MDSNHADPLQQAVEGGNIPVLLAVLYQLTGEQRWLGERYRPLRSKGMDENRTGGLSRDVQEEVRSAVVDAVTQWRSGRPAARPRLELDELCAVIDFTMGEPVPPEFAPMMAEIVEGTPPPEPARELRPDLHAVVIGAGIAGMLASVRLTEAGIDHIVIEKNANVGGSWHENRYPGAGVDTPSYLYSYSFFDRAWSTHFGKRDEVQSYLEEFASTFLLSRRIRFQTEVTQARWDEDAQLWHITTRADDGTVAHLDAPILISAVGLLNRPKVPELFGMATFRGRLFHSAQWPVDLTMEDLADKKVAIVGAGASAMQIGPAIAGQVRSLTVFQRSPQWIAPNDDYFEQIGPDIHWLMANVPYYRGWYRARLSWLFNDKVHPTLQVDPDWPEPTASINAANHGHRQFYERYLRSELDGRPDLIAKSLPDYPPFGKRMLLDNGWFHMMRRPEVELVTRGVAEVTADGVIDSAGERHEADIIILATGFHTDRLLYPMEVIGRSGRSTAEVWGDHDAWAYLGMTVPDFPNLFIMTGPNTALGHGGSFITILECQIRYIIDALTTMSDRSVAVLECRETVCSDYNRRVDEAHAAMVWTHPAMDNWYRNPDGRVVAVLPWRIVDYWNLTRNVALEDYRAEPRR